MLQKHLMIAFAALLLSSISLAQSANAPAGNDAQPSQQDNQNNQGQRGQQMRRMAMLAQRLNLTDDQKHQWMQIQRETTQQVKAARTDSSLSEEQMQARLKEIHQQQKDRVIALLTPQQQDELKNFWEEQKQKQQQNKTPDGNPDSKASTQDYTETKDDLFADMQPDPDPAPNPLQPKKTSRK